jgi:protein-tyrosine kinase
MGEGDDAEEYTSASRMLPVVRQSRDLIALHVNKTILRAAGLFPPVHQERSIAAQYQQVKRPLVVNAVGGGAAKVQNAKIIMVSSALAGEGKTFTSINLAMSLAREKDAEVLLIDADVLTRRLSRILEVSKSQGLLDCLEDETLDPESLVMPTDIRGLSFLPAGIPCDNSAELFASLRMLKVLNLLNLWSARRILVLDASPLLATTEAQVLATLVGQVVVVVRAGHTPQQAVLDAVDMLESDALIGLILNEGGKRGGGARYHANDVDEQGVAEDGVQYAIKSRTP